MTVFVFLPVDSGSGDCRYHLRTHVIAHMNIYFTDDELRKQGELMLDMLVGTGQESVHGSANSLRFDLLKKHLSGDPIAMRLLYSIVTKMESLIGWKRFECNVLPTFSSVTEVNFNSVMRRSWVMQMLATFVEQSVLSKIENPAAKGIFLKDPTAKDFVVSDPAVGAGWKMVHAWMAKYSEQNCYDRIEECVDGHDGGLTRKCMRFASGLSIASHTPGHELPPPSDALDDALSSLHDQSDALACYCLDNDIEYMTEAQCRLATCLPGGNPQRRKEAFQKLVSHGLWKHQSSPQGTLVGLMYR